MISLSPIHRSIRDTLNKKIKSVSRDFENNPLDPKSGLQESYTKTVWCRMFSAVDSTAVAEKIQEEAMFQKEIWESKPGMKPGMKNAVIMGGETKDSKKEEILFGFDDIYSPRTANKTGKLEVDPAGLKRPMAGIRSIDINYKGGLSAIRTATINWTCWSFDDIKRLSPHFMAHGKGVLIEWGYSTPEVDQYVTFGKQDMLDGKAYTKIKERIVELGGNYDAMAGIISNWEWELRDDGGFDCTTKIVSRGVNILDGDISGHDTSHNDEDGNRELTASEFVGILRENIIGLCAEEDGWLMGKARNLSLHSNQNWTRSSKLQPPGCLYIKIDTWGWTNKVSGPWVSWGFFEDNILSKFVGRYEKDSGKVVNSFRSIEPVLHPDGSGGFLKNDGITSTNNIHEARFQSVKIKNSKWLLTTDAFRWVLPNNDQFKIKTMEFNKWEDWEDHFYVLHALGAAVNENKFFPQFAVPKSDLKQGYLRNIVLNYDLITKSFENANTVKQGMSNLFNELNNDTDGFWGFEIVDDPYIDGNVKVVDSGVSSRTPKGLLTERKEYMNKDENDEFGNPESEIFTFPSWGEKSIVKSQTLAAKLPSAMAVSAMYAGSAAPGTERKSSTLHGTVIAELAGESGIDHSQPNIVPAGKISRQKVFGSKSPWGEHSFYNRTEEERKYLPPDKTYWEQGGRGWLKSDNSDGTTVPSGEVDEGGFGPGHGVPFTQVKYKEYLEKVVAETDANSQEAKAAAKRLEDHEAASAEADDNFHKLHPHSDEPTSGKYNRYKSIVLKKPRTIRDDRETFYVYRHDGILSELAGFPIFMHRSMCDYIHGQGLSQTQDEEIEESGDPMIPIELEITIDGIGGIVPGNAFHVDYIPDRYKKFCVFQAIKVDHSVAGGGWTTTIKGLPRVDVRGILGAPDYDANAKHDKEFAEFKGSIKSIVKTAVNVANYVNSSFKTMVGKDPRADEMGPSMDTSHLGYDNSLGRLNSGERPSNDINKVDKIILHHTGDSSAVQTWKTLRNRPTKSKLGLSVHYIVDLDGTIHNPVPEEKEAFHAGAWNDWSIGIEIVHTGKKNMDYTAAQYAAITELINDIADRWPSIEADDAHVLAHYQATTSGKWDPSPNFDWSRIGLPNHKTLASLNKRPDKYYYEA